MGEYKIDNARMDIIGKLNRCGDEFPELKKEVFYYDEKLKCFTNKLKRQSKLIGHFMK